MAFRRKRETWGVTYTGTTGQEHVVGLGSRRKARRVAAALQSVYSDIEPVRLPRG